MDGLKDTRWNQLHHAYGTCEDFPRVLQALGSAALDERRWARNWLEELLFHQGTHYPANEYAVPFLLHAAANPAIPERDRLFNFLLRFLAEKRVPKSPEQYRLWKKRFLKKYGMNSGGEEWRNLRRKSLGAAWNTRDLLMKMAAADPDVAGRCWALFLLADLGLTGRHYGGSYVEDRPCDWFSSDAIAEILCLLGERAVADSSPTVRVCAVFGIGFLRDDPEAAVLLRQLDVANKDPAMRLAAAAARLITERSLPGDVSARVVDGIVKNELRGFGTACIYDGSESVLIGAYGRLGLELDPGKPPSTTGPFAWVPFPKLTAWLNAALDDDLPFAELAEEIIKRRPRAEKLRAVRLLGSLERPTSKASELLRGLLGHRDPIIRMKAALVLGRYKSKQRLPVNRIARVFRAPLQSRDAGLRLRAIRNLGLLWSPKPNGPIPQSMPMVVRVAKKESDPRVRQAICIFLDRAALEDRIGKDLEPPLSADAKGAIRILVGWIDDPNIGATALKALREFYSPYHVKKGPTAPREALEPLLKLLNSDFPHRRNAPAILARVRSDKVLPAFLDSLRREKDPDVRVALRWALSRLPGSVDPVNAILVAHQETGLAIDGQMALYLATEKRKSIKVAETLVQVLRSAPRDEASVTNRCKMVEAIGCLSGSPELTSAALLDSALNDPNDQVKAAAANAFACAPVPVELVLAGCRRIADSHDDAAIAGMLQLLEYGNTPTMPELGPALLFLLDHPNHHRREKAIKALAKFRARSAEVERAVLRRLNDESGSVVYQAAQYPFQVLPADEVVPPLVKLAPNLGIALWQNLKDRASTEDLLPVVENWLADFGDWELRSLCRWVEQQGAKAASLTPTLLTRLNDPQPGNRFEIIKALIAVDSSQRNVVFAALDVLLAHELDVVRKQAAEMRANIAGSAN